MAIQQQITEDVKTAMRARDKTRLSVLRFVLAEIKPQAIAKRETLTNEEVLAVLVRQVKRRQESISQYQKGGRDDLVQQEQAELEPLQQYLPQPLSESVLTALIAEAIETTQAVRRRDRGKVIDVLKPKVQGRADMKKLSQQVSNALED